MQIGSRKGDWKNRAVLTAIAVIPTLVAQPALGFSSNNVACVRAFSRDHAPWNESITVSVTITNLEPGDLRGFYYAEQVPVAMAASTISLTLDGVPFSGYIVETGPAGAVYPSAVEYRWVLETPPAFAQDNAVGSGATLRIVYSIRSETAGEYHCDEFHWVGYFAGGARSAFGYSEDADKKTVTILSPAKAAGWERY